MALAPLKTCSERFLLSFLAAPSLLCARPLACRVYCVPILLTGASLADRCLQKRVHSRIGCVLGLLSLQDCGLSLQS
ncbi:hypothetical protein GGP81_002466 [Salinibacter ruber]|nr:hypothetical protein [Salinibacter ruber]